MEEQNVTVPFEYFLELTSLAENRPPTPLNERVANTIQTTVFCMVLVGAVTAGSWGWAHAMDWLEKKSFERKYESTRSKKPNDK